MKSQRAKRPVSTSLASSPGVVGGPSDLTPAEKHEGKAPLAYLVSVFAGGNLLSAALNTIGGLLTAAVVSPATLGLFQAIGISQRYVRFLHLGVPVGLNRDVAYYLGCGESEKVERLAGAGLAFLLRAAAAAGLIIAGIGIWAAVTSGRADLTAGWFTFAVVGFLTVLQPYLLSIFRVHDAFPRLAAARVIQGVLNVALVVFVVLFGFYALCARSILSLGALMTVLWVWLPRRFKPKWDTEAVKELMSTGLPIWGAGQLIDLWDVFNATLMVALMGTEGFGLYAIARIIGQALKTFPTALQQVLQPRITMGFARNGDLAGSFRQSYRPTFAIASLFIPVAVIGWLLLPPAVAFALPKYTPGVGAAQWVLPLVAIQNFRPPIAVLAAVSKRQHFNVVAIAAGFTVYLIVLGWLIKDGVYLAAFPQALVAGGVVNVATGYLLAARFLARNDG